MKDVVVIGCMNVDILVQPCEESVFKNGSYTCDAIRMSVGGDALNEATILSRMGKDVQLIGVFGNDDAGKYIKAHCLDQKIDIDESCFRKDLISSINVVLIKSDGSRHFLTNGSSSLRVLRLEDIPLNFEGKILSFASIFVFPLLKDDELSTLFSYAKSKGMIVCADMTRKKNQETVEDLKRTLPLIDYIFPNDTEALLFTGAESVEEAAERLYEAGVKNVLIKIGENGCYVKNDMYAKVFPVNRKVECIDTTGAGDSFAAGFIKCLSEDKSFEQCIEYANWCGSENVQRIGATDWSQQFIK